VPASGDLSQTRQDAINNKIGGHMNLANRSYEEKRSFIRMKVNTPVDVKLDQQRQLAGICHNLSGGGMLISIPESLPLGAELEVTLSSHHGHSPMLRARTKVNRVQPEIPQQSSRVGLEILELLD
jgi:c-di-GMP-binding flagellar brake protein YcgR